jgi:hypothetical protein
MLVTAAFFGGWVANDWKRERELRQLRPLPSGPITNLFPFIGTEFIELQRKPEYAVEELSLPYPDEGPLLSLPPKEYWERITKE